MAYLPLSLGVRRAADSKGAVFSDRLPTKAQTEKVLHRDSFSCRCCGFTSKRFQRVIPAEGARGEGEESLVTVCSFCELSFALDRAGQLSGALLIWLPELSQAELNHVMRAIYVARASKETALAEAATRTLEVLLSRRAEAKKRLGTDDPLILATALAEAVDDATYAARMSKLEGLRVLPQDRYLVRQNGSGDTNIFPQMVAYWTSSEGPFGKTPVSEWSRLFGEVLAKAHQ